MKTVRKHLFCGWGHRVSKPGRNVAMLAAAWAALTLAPPPARADLKLCNTTASRIGVAIGYKEKDEWTSEGWWNVASQSCEVLLKGGLIARYYYIHAIDYDHGGQWGGAAYMCTDDKAFTIHGVGDCPKRGYKRTGFFEVDTKEEKDWTIKLTDPSDPGGGQTGGPGQ
jgi:uncharacterized membrane protein